MNCKICNSSLTGQFTTNILKKYKATFYQCNRCGFLQTFDDCWFEEAHRQSIVSSDTGMLSRNIYFSNIASIIIYFFFSKNGKYLDHAGGYGIFNRLMRDIGFDFYWNDPFTTNLFSKGFEFDIEKKNQIQISLITSFEVFEHYKFPLTDIEKMLSICPNILFSTQILPTPTPKPTKWWYYGFHHGQHVSFYKLETLNFIANKYHLNFYTNRSNLHLFTKKPINPILFRIATKCHRIGLNKFVKFKMKSKTMEDCYTLSK